MNEMKNIPEPVIVSSLSKPSAPPKDRPTVTNPHMTENQRRTMVNKMVQGITGIDPIVVEGMRVLINEWTKACFRQHTCMMHKCELDRQMETKLRETLEEALQTMAFKAGFSLEMHFSIDMGGWIDLLIDKTDAPMVTDPELVEQMHPYHELGKVDTQASMLEPAISAP